MLDSAELLHFRTAMLGAHTLVVAVSQSGESAEVVKVAEHIRSSAVPSRIVAVTNGRTNALASLADDVLDTAAGEESGPSTMTFAGSLVVVGAIAAVLTGYLRSGCGGPVRTRDRHGGRGHRTPARRPGHER